VYASSLPAVYLAGTVVPAHTGTRVLDAARRHRIGGRAHWISQVSSGRLADWFAGSIARGFKLGRALLREFDAGRRRWLPQRRVSF
jgi:hypothetical protein